MITQRFYILLKQDPCPSNEIDNNSYHHTDMDPVTDIRGLILQPEY